MFIEVKVVHKLYSVRKTILTPVTPQAVSELKQPASARTFYTHVAPLRHSIFPETVPPLSCAACIVADKISTVVMKR